MLQFAKLNFCLVGHSPKFSEQTLVFNKLILTIMSQFPTQRPAGCDNLMLTNYVINGKEGSNYPGMNLPD